MPAAFPDPPPMLETPSSEQISLTRRRAVSQGGAALNLPHSGRTTRFKKPPSGVKLGELGIGYTEREDLCNCGHTALFTLPAGSTKASARAVRICAVCDAGVDFPILQES